MMFGGRGVYKREKLRTKRAWEAKISGHEESSIVAGGSQELGRWLDHSVVGECPVNQLNKSHYSSCTLQVWCPRQVD